MFKKQICLVKSFNLVYGVMLRRCNISTIWKHFLIIGFLFVTHINMINILSHVVDKRDLERPPKVGNY